jgi:transposase InsO family protein
MQKATMASTFAKKKARRNWKNFGPGQMLQPDITYLFYRKYNSKKAYLSTMRDACTPQILSYVPSVNLKENFVQKTVDNLLKNHGSQLSKNIFCHSDKGVHYSAQEYVRKLKKYNIKRSFEPKIKLLV